jgi:hypothetical protein
VPRSKEKAKLCVAKGKGLSQKAELCVASHPHQRLQAKDSICRCLGDPFGGAVSTGNAIVETLGTLSEKQGMLIQTSPLQMIGNYYPVLLGTKALFPECYASLCKFLNDCRCM